MTLRRSAALVAENGAFYLLGGLLAASAKLFYRRAGAEELGWILAPTCWLAELSSGIEFERERHAGWVSHSARMIIGPSCAGVNFLVIAFVTLFFSFVHRLNGPHTKGLWLAVSAGAAYLLAIGTNSLRIVAAAQLHTADHAGWITPGQIHRILGTIVYCVSLLLAHRTVARLVTRVAPRDPRTLFGQLVPFAWYALIALGLPLAGLAHRRDGDRFVEHAVIVVSVLVALSVVLVVVHAANGLWRRSPSGSRERGW